MVSILTSAMGQECSALRAPLATAAISCVRCRLTWSKFPDIVRTHFRASPLNSGGTGHAKSQPEVWSGFGGHEAESVSCGLRMNARL